VIREQPDGRDRSKPVGVPSAGSWA